MEFSPRNLPKDQSLLSYDSDNSVASDPGYTAVRRPGRVVEQAEVVIETSPTGRVSGGWHCTRKGTLLCLVVSLWWDSSQQPFCLHLLYTVLC